MFPLFREILRVQLKEQHLIHRWVPKRRVFIQNWCLRNCHKCGPDFGVPDLPGTTTGQ